MLFQQPFFNKCTAAKYFTLSLKRKFDKMILITRYVKKSIENLFILHSMYHLLKFYMKCLKNIIAFFFEVVGDFT